MKGIGVDYSSIFEQEIIQFGLSAKNYTEAIQSLGDLLLKHGYVKDTYTKNAIDREKEFPTGLPLGKDNVALPHTDSIHVNRQGIALGILENPVDFHIMGNPEEVVPVRLVFLMAIKENDDQVKMLQVLMDMIQKPAFISTLLCAKSKAEILDILCSSIAN